MPGMDPVGDRQRRARSPLSPALFRFAPQLRVQRRNLIARWGHQNCPPIGGQFSAPIDTLERILREIRRRTRVVGAFPDGQWALNLAVARLRHVAGTEWSTKRYLSMDLLKDHQLTRTTA